MRTIVAIGIAGALGALARYGLDGVVCRRLPTSFPWGTFVVNISGALVLGFLLTLMTEQLTTAPWLRSALTIGFLGAYTTFSTLQYETYRLLEDGAVGTRRRERLRQRGRRPLRRLPRGRRREGAVKLEGEGKLLRLFIGESDTWHGKPLYQAIVERVRKEGLAGATVLRGIEGFGADSRLHTSRILRLSEDLPVVIEIVDTPEQIDRVVPILDEMVGEGMLTLERVHIVSYRSSDN